MDLPWLLRSPALTRLRLGTRPSSLNVHEPSRFRMITVAGVMARFDVGQQGHQQRCISAWKPQARVSTAYYRLGAHAGIVNTDLTSPVCAGGCSDGRYGRH